jgi:hypothetical protein
MPPTPHPAHGDGRSIVSSYDPRKEMLRDLALWIAQIDALAETSILFERWRSRRQPMMGPGRVHVAP